MNLFKKYKIDSFKTEYKNDEEKNTNSTQNDFRSSIKIDDYESKMRLFRLKEDLIQGKITEKDIATDDLDGVTQLLNEESEKNRLKIKHYEEQIVKHKRQNT